MITIFTSYPRKKEYYSICLQWVKKTCIYIRHKHRIILPSPAFYHKIDIFDIILPRIPLHYACENGYYDVTEALITNIENMKETQCLISKDAKGIFLFMIIVQLEIHSYFIKKLLEYKKQSIC